MATATQPVLDFDALYREHFTYIVTVCRTYAAEKDDAEDLAQATFLRAYRFRNTFRGDAAPQTWLYRIAVNVCRADASRTTRAKWRPRLVSFEQLAGGTEESPVKEDWQPAIEARQEREIEERERNQHLASLVMRLRANVRIVVRLRYFEGKTIEETAHILGLTESATKAKSHRGITFLREELGCTSTR